MFLSFGHCHAGLTQRDDVEHESTPAFPVIWDDFCSSHRRPRPIKFHVTLLHCKPSAANLSRHHICLINVCMRLTSFCTRKSRMNGFKPIQSIQIQFSNPLFQKFSKAYACICILKWYIISQPPC
jgi:hypothetical protein